MVNVGLFNHGFFYSQLKKKGFAYILGKLVMHPCVPFCSGAPLPFFGAP